MAKTATAKQRLITSRSIPKTRKVFTSVYWAIKPQSDFL